MITRVFIEDKARQSQTTELNIAREYCQHLFLSNLYQQKLSDKILFKGGTALKIIYNSPRFSEDLDFTGQRIRTREIEDMIIEVLTNISDLGISVNIKESEKTSGGYLGTLNFNFLDFDIEIQIEVSLRKTDKIEKQGLTIVSDFIPAYSIITLSQEKIVQEKIEALLARSKPRDWYDLYFILRANLLPPRSRKLLKEILKKLIKKKTNFRDELKNFLPKSYYFILKDFKKNLEREIKRFG